jgi:GNAT superfamily N-acetyltransferase
MSVIIREAIKEDCIRLLELINELAVYEKAPDEVTVSLEEFVNAGFGTNSIWKAFVAEYDGIIQGFGLYYIRYSTWKGCRMYLEDLLVTENMRGKGLGKMIFDRLIEEAKERKFKGITWQVLDWNESAINFYKKYNTEFDSGWINVSLSENQVNNL